jgi:hypothetical protein
MDFERDLTSRIAYNPQRIVFGRQRFIHSTAFQKQMLRWLIVLQICTAFTLGPSACCCGLQIADFALGFWKNSAQKIPAQASTSCQGQCCSPDDSDLQTCPAQLSVASEFNFRDFLQKPSDSSESNCDCCSNGNNCRCFNASQAVTLPNSITSDFERTLQQLKLSSWTSTGDLIPTRNINHSLTLTDGLGSSSRTSLSMIQRWNC